MYVLTDYLRSYMRKHKKIELTDEQLNLIVELFYAFHELHFERLVSDEDVQMTRKSICSGCVHFINETSCDKCGCTINSKVKDPTHSCPVNKWGIDLKPMKDRFLKTIDFLNDRVDTNFYDQLTLEEIEEKYRKIIESGEKHE
jgi:hypothetical protein